MSKIARLTFQFSNKTPNPVDGVALIHTSRQTIANHVIIPCHKRFTFGLFFPDFPKALRVSTIKVDFLRMSS